MKVIYKRFAELWNSKDDEFNNILLERLKNQIIFKPNDIKLYNTMPFYHNDILITLLTYATDKKYVKEFIYLYTCRKDLLDEEFLNNMKKQNLISQISKRLFITSTNLSKLHYSKDDNAPEGKLDYVTKEIFSETGKLVEINSNRILESKYVTKMIC